MDEPGGADGLSPATTRVYLAARALLRAIAPLVPANRRVEWRQEWESECWHWLAERQRARRLDLRATLEVARRVSGALPHALWLRRSEWRLEVMIQDLRYALRSALRRPAFAALIVFTLALGIGANSAMFTVVNSVLIRPLPYERPRELVLMNGSFRGSNEAAISPPDFLDYRERQNVFSSFAARLSGNNVVLSGGDTPERIPAASVTANFFATLGVTPLLGRTFTPAEEEGGGHDLAVLSYGLWLLRFGGDSSVLGRAVAIDGHPATIIGVMPPVLDRTLGERLWQPIQFHTSGTSTRRFHFLRAIGRLRPGETLPHAQAAMDLIARQLEAAYPENATWKLRLRPYRDVVVGTVGTALLFLLGAVGFVLLIACANVANLLLARASAREGEIAIRTALGASPLRIVKQLLTESLVLATAGGTLGFWLATVLVKGVRAAGVGIVPRLAEVQVDNTVLIFTGAISLATGLAFGAAPALQSARAQIAGSLGALGRSAGGRRGSRVRDTLVVAQVALSLVLLVGAGLLIKSLWRLEQVPSGVDAEHVWTAQLSLPAQRYADSLAQDRFWTALLGQLRAIPGVTAVSATTMPPLTGGWDTYFWREDRPPADAAGRQNAMVNIVAEGYFETMRIPLAAGRSFGPAERAGEPKAVVISRSIANRLFRGEDPIGKQLVVDFGKPTTEEIVGVAGDVRAFGLDNDAPDTFYFPASQVNGFGSYLVTLVVRTSRDAGEIAGMARAALSQLDRDVPLANVQMMSDVVDASTSGRRFGTRLLGGFAGVALLLATIGLYGVLANAVAQRTRELGIRMALGARPNAVIAVGVRRGLGLVALGAAIGLGGAFGAARLIERLLFGVGRGDPAVYAIVTLTLAAAGLAACLIPARRAIRVDPVLALRGDQ